MADPSPSRDGLAQIADQINALWRAVGELKAPSGTQQANAVAQLEAAVVDLQAQQAQIVAQQEQITVLVSDLDERITDFINENIDDIVAAQVTAALAAADITLGRSGGVVRIPSIITTDLTSASGRVVTWTAADGRIGHT